MGWECRHVAPSARTCPHPSLPSGPREVPGPTRHSRRHLPTGVAFGGGLAPRANYPDGAAHPRVGPLALGPSPPIYAVHTCSVGTRVDGPMTRSVRACPRGTRRPQRIPRDSVGRPHHPSPSRDPVGRRARKRSRGRPTGARQLGATSLSAVGQPMGPAGHFPTLAARPARNMLVRGPRRGTGRVEPVVQSPRPSSPSY